ncbi:hypothetical protein HAZT_HAZT007406 [Hyalella azteca]|uniref:Pseudouridine-5'-phosphate glycosidase n=1 Tax=Hyalella azteca TaxID=294128 RepID=A0A6A0HD55_HYAAZ|nr:hypothetical protein HAZT_HAZT007406 [Hyalella azteca]
MHHQKQVWPFIVNEEVRSAIAEGRPVVALESAIITHGMPAPHNLTTAMKLEEIIRGKGCIPATIGMLKGQLTVGLSSSQLHMLADTCTKKHKISTRDLAFAATKKVDGGTTVSTTLHACRLAGIDVFVTGGIGGVHKVHSSGATTWDVSADLIELGHCQGVGVVCSGIKSILDVPATLEYLETQGVSATVLDRSLEAQCDPAKVFFPDFFTRNSGIVATSFITDPSQAAEMIHQAKKLALRSGLIFAVPIPESAEPAGAEIKMAIEKAVSLARRSSVTGRDVTPFVLSEVLRMTDGRSLAANSALIQNNAATGAHVASALAKLRTENPSRSSSRVPMSYLNFISIWKSNSSRIFWRVNRWWWWVAAS